MNIQELQTVVSEGLPVKILVINNMVLANFLRFRPERIDVINTVKSILS